MYILNLLALLSSLLTPASGFQIGTSCGPIGRRAPGVADMPKLDVLRRCLSPRGRLSHTSSPSPFVKRSGKPPMMPTITEAQSMDWKPQSSPGPSEASASTSRKRKRPSSSDTNPEDDPGHRHDAPYADYLHPAPYADHLVRAPLDSNRQNVPHPDRNAAMHVIDMPDPTRFKGFKDPITGERSYFRSMRDGHGALAASASMTRQFGAGNPSYLMTTSENQAGDRLGAGPGRWHEFKYLDDVDDSKYDSPLWFQMTPRKEPAWAPWAFVPWSSTQLRRTLVSQHQEFPNHDSLDENSIWARLDRDLRRSCKIQVCPPERLKALVASRKEKPEPLTP